MDRYKYLIFDGQYFLTRNYKAKLNTYKTDNPYVVDGVHITDESGKPLYKVEPKWTAMDLCRSLFQSVVKFTREVASAQKVILAWDKYPYHKFQLVQDYKGSRHYETEEDLKGLDPIKDAKQIIDTQFMVDCNGMKTEAKYWFIPNLERAGVSSFIKSGWEADDWAGCMCKFLYENEPDAKVGIVSIDSDWDYLIQPNSVHIRPNGNVTTYETMYAKHKDDIEKHGITLYQYGGLIDSIYGSHNDLKRTLKEGLPKSLTFSQIIDSVLDGSDDYITDRGLFDAQMRSFDYTKYPDYEESVSRAMYHIKNSGHITDAFEFATDEELNKMKVRTSYYYDFVSRLDSSLYSK